MKQKKEAGLEVMKNPKVTLNVSLSLRSPLYYLPHLSLGGSGVWPLVGGQCDQQSGFLSQRCPGAAPPAASQRQRCGDGHS